MKFVGKHNQKIQNLTQLEVYDHVTYYSIVKIIKSLKNAYNFIQTFSIQVLLDIVIDKCRKIYTCTFKLY